MTLTDRSKVSGTSAYSMGRQVRVWACSGRGEPTDVNLMRAATKMRSISDGSIDTSAGDFLSQRALAVCQRGTRIGRGGRRTYRHQHDKAARRGSQRTMPADSRNSVVLQRDSQSYEIDARSHVQPTTTSSAVAKYHLANAVCRCVPALGTGRYSPYDERQPATKEMITSSNCRSSKKTYWSSTVTHTCMQFRLTASSGSKSCR